VLGYNTPSVWGGYTSLQQDGPEFLSLPAPFSLAWAERRGQVSFALPKPVKAAPAEKAAAALIEGQWGDQRFEVLVNQNALEAVAELVFPGCNLALAWSEIRAMVVEHILSQALVMGRQDVFEGVRVQRVALNWTNPVASPILDIAVSVESLELTLHLHGTEDLATALHRRMSALPQVAVQRPAFPIEVRIIAGATIMPVSDLLRLKAGQGILLDVSLLKTNRVMVFINGRPAARARPVGHHMVIEERLDTTEAAVPAAWYPAPLLPGETQLMFELGRMPMTQEAFDSNAASQGIAMTARPAGEVDIFADDRLFGLGGIVQIGQESGIRVARIF
jgi:flagellar motor switch/type III secretory pathway protein FliN